MLGRERNHGHVCAGEVDASEDVVTCEMCIKEIGVCERRTRQVRVVNLDIRGVRFLPGGLDRLDMLKLRLMKRGHASREICTGDIKIFHSRLKEVGIGEDARGH